MKRSFHLGLCWLPLVPFCVSAQSQTVSPPDKGQVVISGGGGSTSIYDSVQGIGRLNKDVVITQKGENLIVYAQQATYSNKLNEATATGNLRVVTRDSTIRGLNLRADFNQRRFTISGAVKITSHGKNDGAMAGLRGETKERPVTVLCDQAIWEYDTRQAVATGNIRIYQDASRGTCNKIIYDETKNTIILQGDVQFGDDKNRTFLAQEIYVFPDANMVSTDSKVTMKFAEKPGMNGDVTTGKVRIPVPAAPKLPDDFLKDFDRSTPLAAGASMSAKEG